MPSPNDLEQIIAEHDLEQIELENPVWGMGFAQISHMMARDSRISGSAYRYYSQLLYYAQQKSYCFPSRDEIAEVMSVDVRTVTRWNTQLVKAGYITRKQYYDRPNLTIIKDVNKHPVLLRLCEEERERRRRKALERQGIDPTKMSSDTRQKCPTEEEPYKKNHGRRTITTTGATRREEESQLTPASGELWLAMTDPTVKEWQCPNCKLYITYDELEETGMCPHCHSRIGIRKGSLSGKILIKPAKEPYNPDPLALANIIPGIDPHLGQYRCFSEDEADKVRAACELDRTKLIKLLNWASQKHDHHRFGAVEVVQKALAGFYNKKEDDEHNGNEQGDGGEDSTRVHADDEIHYSFGPDEFGLLDR